MPDTGLSIVMIVAGIIGMSSIYAIAVSNEDGVTYWYALMQLLLMVGIVLIGIVSVLSVCVGVMRLLGQI